MRQRLQCLKYQNRKEVNTLAFTRKEKEAMVEQYKSWIDGSNAFFVLSYQNMRMAAVDDAREKLREVNAELHVVKNRLFRLVLDEMDMDYEEGFWEENNMVGFAFSDAPSVAKVITEISKSAVFDIRLGYMDQKLLTAENVKALADLPTQPVMRGILLGTIMASASKLVRTLAEPARSMAAVVKAFSEEGQAA
jgi:large subunit ribosomal protein L10